MTEFVIRLKETRLRHFRNEQAKSNSKQVAKKLKWSNKMLMEFLLNQSTWQNSLGL